MEWKCTGRESKVDGLETEKACEEQLLVTRFVLVERKNLDGR